MRSFTVRRIFVAMTIASCFFALGNAQDQQDEKKVAAEAVNQPTPDLYLRQWISYGVDGSVEGTVVTYEGSEVAAAPNTTVRLISNGLAKLQTVTNERGEFKLHGVNPGVYSVVASNGRGIAAFSLVVLPGEAGSHLPKSVEIPLVDPAGRGVQKLIPSTFVPGVSSLGMPILADPLGSARRFADSRVISTDATGVLKGKIEQVIGHASRDYSDMTVYFFQNDRIVKNASVERTGEFSVSGLPSGVYGAVAAGTSGFSAFSFELKSMSSFSMLSKENRFVSLQTGSLNFQIIQPSDSIFVDPTNTGSDVGQPTPAGGMAGGGAGPVGGGGGGGGGIGGGGGLLGAAGLAAGAAAFGNGNGFVPVPINSIP